MVAKPDVDEEVSPIVRACAILAGIPVHEVLEGENVRGVTAMAGALKVSKPTVSQWIPAKRSHRRPIPPVRCLQIERLTGVTCEELRPDIDWSVLRGQKRKRKHA